MIRKHRIKVKQHDITDCGAACLVSVAAHYGLKMPVAKIRQLASTDKKGTNLLGMIEAAGRIGFTAKGVKGSLKSLEDIPLPAIAHVLVKSELHHYIVIYRVTAHALVVMDPLDGSLRKISCNEFEEQWSGVLLLLMPDAGFEPGDRKVSVLSRLLFLLKPHVAVLGQVLFGALVFTVMGLSTAIFVQLIVDYVLNDSNSGLLNLLGVSMLVILLVRLLIGVLKSLFTIKTGQLIDARLILGYYKHLLKLPQSFFDTMRTGEIISRINDAVKIRVFINDIGMLLAVNIFTVIFSFGLMFTWYWKLGLVMLLVIPVYLVIYQITNRLNRKTQRELMENAADLESHLVNSLRSVSTIKQFGIEEFANIRIETSFVKLLRSVYRSGVNGLFTANATRFTSDLFTVILLWSGAYFVMAGLITPGEMLSFYAVTGYFTGPVNDTIGMNKTVQDALIAADRLFEILDLNRDEDSGSVPVGNSLTDGIRFEDVQFRYGSRVTVFNSLSLYIPGGSVTAVVGESGSGKTTLINLLLKLYPLNGGRILIGQQNLKHISTVDIRRISGVVPQKVDLLPGNVTENIAFGELKPDMQRIYRLCDSLGMIPFIENLQDGFHTWLGENGTVLSGGQKQRIAIARALYRDPQIVIFDEATSSLDSVSGEYIQQAVRLLKERGKTVIIITHRLANVTGSDKICVLKNGRLNEEGSHRHLLAKRGVYYNLWNRQYDLNGVNGTKQSHPSDANLSG